ncbi:hypothetical protein T08_10454 [Trichinella sp. T8]|nr:hypothetical protein T08_10454 [Trichinella sp. T8]
MERLDVIRLQQLKTTAPRDEPPQCSQKTHHRHVWNHLFLSSPLLYTVCTTGYGFWPNVEICGTFSQTRSPAMNIVPVAFAFHFQSPLGHPSWSLFVASICRISNFVKFPVVDAEPRDTILYFPEYHRREPTLLRAFLMGFTLSTNFLNLCFMTLLRPRSPSDNEVVSTYCRNRPAIFSRVSSVQFVAVHTGVVITVVVTLTAMCMVSPYLISP